LNPDGTVYHLGLRAEDVPDLIFTVGDPDRVNHVAQYFDKILWQKTRREFNMVRGVLKGERQKHVLVLSTGMGTDNIDIVLQELDAAVNIDLEKRQDVEEEKQRRRRQLTIVRIGTSGAIDPELPLGSHLYSAGALSFDGLLPFYKHSFEKLHIEGSPVQPYYIPPTQTLSPDDIPDLHHGITATLPGFYGPQGRNLRTQSTFGPTMDRLVSVTITPVVDGTDNNQHSKEKKNLLHVTNFEMETAGIYALAHLLGHVAYSFSALLANRALGTFHDQPTEAVDALIQKVLDWAATNPNL
jgi:uridine phosphorylase